MCSNALSGLTYLLYLYYTSRSSLQNRAMCTREKISSARAQYFTSSTERERAREERKRERREERERERRVPLCEDKN